MLEFGGDRPYRDGGDLTSVRSDVQRSIQRTDLRNMLIAMDRNPSASLRGPSMHGSLLVMLAASLALSAFRPFRIELSGLLVHPFHIGLAGSLLLVGFRGLGRIPGHVLVGLVLFLGLFALATLSRPGGVGIFVKTAAATTTLGAAIALVRRDEDMPAVAVGLLFAVSVISLKGLAGGGLDKTQGINPMAGIANKNAFSLYTLPPLLIGGHALLFQTIKLRTRVLVVTMLTLVSFAMLSTGNRSGWFGLALIMLMLWIPAVRRVRQAMAVVALVGTLVFLVAEFGNQLVIQSRIERTTDGYKSDDYRVELVRRGLVVGLKNPLIGVSPQRVPVEMARLDGIQTLVVTTHNVFTLLFAGGGFLVTGSLVLLAFLCFANPVLWGYERPSSQARVAHRLLRFMLVLWAFRGVFSDEILYSPSFSLGLGACIGWARCRGLWRRQPLQSRTVAFVSQRASG